MGKVMTRIRLTNSADLENRDAGALRPEQVRTLELEALVDTGATTLAIPQDAADALGLVERRRRRVRLADGTIAEFAVVLNLVVEILGRDTVCEAFVLPAGTTALIGQIPLEALDLIVDPSSREVRVNPASPDAPLLDLLRAS
jgi:clan AA aspartic protease